MNLGFWLTLASPAKPLMVGPVSHQPLLEFHQHRFPDFPRQNDADEDDVTERSFRHLHVPFSFQNMGRREPPQLLICQTGTHCYRRSDVMKGTHTLYSSTAPKKGKICVFLFFFSYSNG